MILIDPASGWQYGFPKPFDKKPEQSLEDWLVANGYPAKMAKQVANNEIWCRYIGNREELERASEK